MEKNQNKALWIFPNFKETIDTIPQKYRGRAWEMLIEYGFNGEIDLSKENKYIQIVVKSLLPLMRLRGVGGSIGGKSNNPTGKKRANVGANVGANIGANIGATPYKQEQEQEIKQEIKQEKENNNPDWIFENDFSKCFEIYSENCKNLIKLSFEKRNRETLALLDEVFEALGKDYKQFKELCIKANELVTIAEKKIDLKMMLRNYIGILNGKYKEPSILDGIVK